MVRAWSSPPRALTLSCAAIVAIAAPLAAAPPAHVATIETSPVALSRVETSSGIESPRPDLKVELHVLNTSRQRIDELELQALVLSPSGQLKGFHTFTLDVDLAPAERAYLAYRTEQFVVGPGERVLLVPYRVAGPGFTWRLPAEQAKRVLADVERRALAGEEPERAWAADTDPPVDGIEPPLGHCRSLCAERDTSCLTACRCGVQSFSCNCSDESISSACSCYQCPPNPGS